MRAVQHPHIQSLLVSRQEDLLGKQQARILGRAAGAPAPSAAAPSAAAPNGSSSHANGHAAAYANGHDHALNGAAEPSAPRSNGHHRAAPDSPTRGGVGLLGAANGFGAATAATTGSSVPPILSSALAGGRALATAAWGGGAGGALAETAAADDDAAAEQRRRRQQQQQREHYLRVHDAMREKYTGKIAAAHAAQSSNGRAK